MNYNNLTHNPEKTWYVTFDHEVCNDCENATQEQVDQLLKDGYTECFRLYDDDEELYYTGWAKPDADFDPLDDFGMPNAGCTIIKYQKGDDWETL